MADGKGIYEDERRALPEWAYVSLSEAVTWILAGDSRDDVYIVEMQDRFAAECARKWGNSEGPGWLLEHIKLVREGLTWESVPDCIGQERELLSNEFAHAEQWLADGQHDVADIHEQITEWCVQREAEEKELDRAYDLIWHACANQEITLQGIRVRLNRMPGGEHEEIPFTYFLRPVVHFLGKMPEGHGMLSPKPPETDEELHEQVAQGTDTRPDYLQVLMRRDDVLLIEHRFQEAKDSSRSEVQSPSAKVAPTRRFSLAALTRWYEDRVATWDPLGPFPSEKDDRDAAKKAFPGVTREPLRDLRRRLAPDDWKKPGQRRKRISPN